MYSILDLVASLTLRGAIVIAILNMTVALQGKLSEKTVQANMFNLTTTVSRIISDDCNLTGSGLTSGPYVTYASADTIEVTYGDPSNSFVQTWVKYFVGSTSELATTSNPNDRVLYRALGTSGPGSGIRKAVANGVTQLKFTYYDATGVQTWTTSSIKSFKVYLVMASGDKVNGIYPAAEWTYRFYPYSIY